MFRKTIRILALCLAPALFGGMPARAATEFQIAAQLLSAARAGDINKVQALVNGGANVNFVDPTGLSIVCTALMNNDIKAAQILQVYGADASRCDQQIRQYNQRQPKEDSGGLFSGLSTVQSMTLAAAGAAIAIAGVWWLASTLSDRHSNAGSGGGGNRPDNTHPGGGNGGTAMGWTLGALPIGPAEMQAGASWNFNAAQNLFSSSTTGTMREDFLILSYGDMQNYLMMMRGYATQARGYLGMATLRDSSTRLPLNLSGTTFDGHVAGGGKPMSVALISTNGINADAQITDGSTYSDSSIKDGWLYWAGSPGDATNNTTSRRLYNNTITRGGLPGTTDDDTVSEDAGFDLSGNGTAIYNAAATAYDDALAKIIIGNSNGRSLPDYTGFLPNGQLVAYRTGGDNGGTTDYQNYKAMLSAVGANGDGLVSPNMVSVIANAAPVLEMYGTDTKTVTDVLSYAAGDARKLAFSVWINDYYNQTGVTSTAVADANSFFNGLGSLYRPITIFSTGGYVLDTVPGRTQEATFENAAPLVYSNLEHQFMSVAAVQLNGGTSGFSSVTGYNPSQKITLSQWNDPYGGSDTYRARACGMAGRGSSSVDPWCFAAAGVTDQMAAASMAGAVGAVQSAFGSYMSNDQIFVLMALTADGRALDATTLAGMYQLPPEYQFRVNNGENFLDVFAEVFGYGMVNLDRATTPGTRVFYYSTNRINSSAGNAYWRTASVGSSDAARTALALSGAFGARRGSINIPVFDTVESNDGTMSMPRIFDNSVSLSAGRRAVWLGDALGDFKVRDSQPEPEAQGFSASMSLRESSVDDGYGNIDKLALGYGGESFSFGAKYERNVGDTNILRGDDANQVLAIASNAISTEAGYRAGDWKFGARGFAGAITEEGLLASDPALSGKRELMRLGNVQGAETSAGYDAGIFSFGSAVGIVNESDTTLGAYSDGLLSFGGADTVYLDNTMTIRAGEKLKFSARHTAAQTRANPGEGIIVGLSDLRSDAMSFGAEFDDYDRMGSWSFSVSRPLAVTHGSLKYATADYQLVESDSGFDLAASPYVAAVDLSPSQRETRFGAAYRAQLGDFTSGALGFVYRVHPNHTDEFGNETLLMLKVNHRLGI